MTSVYVKIEGADELVKKLMKMQFGVERIVDNATEYGAEIVRTDIQRRAPGPFIHKEKTGEGQGWASYTIGFDKEHWYYIFLEVGVSPHSYGPSQADMLIWVNDMSGQLVKQMWVDHPGFAARPFLRPGYYGSRDVAIDTMRLTFKKKVLEA